MKVNQEDENGTTPDITNKTKKTLFNTLQKMADESEDLP